jgi:phage tail-like protein
VTIPESDGAGVTEGTARPPAPSGELTPGQQPRAAEAAPQLIIELEGQPVQTFALNVPVVTIGRTPGNVLPLPHEAVSRNHAELQLGPEGAILTDLASKNGTFVGRVRLAPHQPVRLAPGSVIRIGPFVLRYELTPVAAAPVVEEAGERSQAATVRPQVAPAPPPPLAYSPPPPPRPLYEVPLPRDPTSVYLDFLPSIFQDNDFLGRFLLIFQSIWEPLEQRQDHLAMYIDPRTSPAVFLPWLAGWLGVAIGTPMTEGRLRELLSEAVELYRWRGTRYGLTRMIEVCTGLKPQIAESSADPFVLHIRVAIPPDSEADRDAIERLVIANKPAHTGYILEVFS